MICSESFKVDQTVTMLKHCKPRSHFFHNFCVWGLVYNRGIHTGPAFVPSCPMCSRRFHSLDIIHIGIPDRRKLKERISSQAARILADQPPDSRLAAFTGRCPLAFHNEADRARSFYAPSPPTIIYTANDFHPDDMVMVKCIVANFDRSFYMWLARDRDMVEAGTKWQKILEPRWTMDITASRPFFELLVKTLTEQAHDGTGLPLGADISGRTMSLEQVVPRRLEWNDTPRKAKMRHGSQIKVYTPA